MDIIKGYKFFTPEECEKMRVNCDKKKRKLEAVLKKQASAPAAEGKPVFR